MNKNKKIFELYIDYLVTSFSYTTATGLSNLLRTDRGGAISATAVSMAEMIKADLVIEISLPR